MPVWYIICRMEVINGQTPIYHIIERLEGTTNDWEKASFIADDIRRKFENYRPYIQIMIFARDLMPPLPEKEK